MSRISTKILFLLALIGTAPLASHAQSSEPNQLFNLAQKPSSPRFQVTNRVWPTNAGEASICLWKDDKLAAWSVTIDDNSAPDVDWWLAKSSEVGLPLTWFLITGKVNSGPANWGTWSLYNRVLAAGHAVESHTVTHLHPEDPLWAGIEGEYANSITQIETNMPGNKVGFLAYPGGKNAHLNDRNVAAKYYLSARGTTGTPNPPALIDYLSVNAMSNPRLDPTDPAHEFNDVRNLLNPSHKQYRGWAVLIYHKVNPEGAQRFLDFYRDNKANLWGAKYGDVALYGQERDTATLQVVENTTSRIKFTLTDRMSDTHYKYPLTIKVRLPGWTTVKATQGGTSVGARVVTNNGARFALVQAVPDRGQVILTP